MSHLTYTADQLVEQPALQILAHDEVLGSNGTLGRESRTYYISSNRLSMNTNATTQTNFFDDPNSHQPMPNTHQPMPNTHQVDPNTHQVDPNTHQVDPNTHQLLSNLPTDLRARIPSAGTKPRKETLRVLIRDLCAWRALSARDIASLLGGRDHKHLVREFLSPMVHDNVLAHTIPEMDNHPEQRYTVPLHTTTAYKK